MRMSTLRFRMFYLESLKVFHFQCGFWWSTFFPYHVTSLDGAPADFLGMTQNTYLQLYLRTAASLKECTGFVFYWHQSFMVDWFVGFFSCSIRKKKRFCLVWLIKFWSGWKSTGCLLRWIFTEGQFHVSTENGQKEKGQPHQPTPVAFETIDSKRTRS